jgi:hypothetical protein
VLILRNVERLGERSIFLLLIIITNLKVLPRMESGTYGINYSGIFLPVLRKTHENPAEIASVSVQHLSNACLEHYRCTNQHCFQMLLVAEHMNKKPCFQEIRRLSRYIYMDPIPRRFKKVSA